MLPSDGVARAPAVDRGPGDATLGSETEGALAGEVPEGVPGEAGQLRELGALQERRRRGLPLEPALLVDLQQVSELVAPLKVPPEGA
ncbi:hypothetical protein SQ03_05715 [Methylobacterium platani JCM 14648]|uniref:Uncharacterized protein n=2 Tax=Methylobacterium platani TaxID=427683 RepID=A0A179SIE0_9HYPH|nr:hypothetical protein SQ03_05715 [Methylobacterium platani JCM 14648]OAS26284.1 hypothetical protein A5481_06080 [Methylobacterium platani]